MYPRQVRSKPRTTSSDQKCFGRNTLVVWRLVYDDRLLLILSVDGVTQDKTIQVCILASVNVGIGYVDVDTL